MYVCHWPPGPSLRHPVLGVIYSLALSGVDIVRQITGGVIGHGVTCWGSQLVRAGIHAKVWFRYASAEGIGLIDGAVPIAIVNILLPPSRTVAIVRNLLQAIKTVVSVLLHKDRRHIAIAVLNPVVLLLEVPVVVAHLVIRAHPPTMVAVVINNRAAFPTGVARACVSRALANLRELPPRVVEQLIVNRNRRPELFLSHPAPGIVANSARVREGGVVPQLPGETQRFD